MVEVMEVVRVGGWVGVRVEGWGAGDWGVVGALGVVAARAVVVAVAWGYQEGMAAVGEGWEVGWVVVGEEAGLEEVVGMGLEAGRGWEVGWVVGMVVVRAGGWAGVMVVVREAG